MENGITEQSIISLKFMSSHILEDKLCNYAASKEATDTEIIYIKDLQARLEDVNYKNITSPEQFKADATTALYIMNRGSVHIESMLKIQKK